VVPILGIVLSGWLMSFLRWETWARMGVWLAVGLVIHAAYGYRRTRRVMPGGSVDLDALDRRRTTTPHTAGRALAEERVRAAMRSKGRLRLSG
jgi:hypothetical protein